MIVNPTPGALVRDPITKLSIGPGAAIDENDPYFARALLDGDLVPAPTKAPRPGRNPSAQAEERN